MNTSKEKDSVKPRLHLSRPMTFRFNELICDELDSNLFILGDTNLGSKHETLDVITEEMTSDVYSSYSPNRQASHLSVIDEQEESELATKMSCKKELEVGKSKKPNFALDFTKRRKKKGVKEGKPLSDDWKRVINDSDEKRTRQRAAGSPNNVNKGVNNHNSNGSGGQTTADTNVSSPTSSSETTSDLIDGMQTNSHASISLRAPCLSESTYQRPMPFERSPQLTYEGVTKSESHLTQMCPQHVSGLREQGPSNNTRLQGGKHSNCVKSDDAKNANEALSAAQEILNQLLLSVWQIDPIDSGEIGGQRCPSARMRQLVNEIGDRINELRNVVDGQMVNNEREVERSETRNCCDNDARNWTANERKNCCDNDAKNRMDGVIRNRSEGQPKYRGQYDPKFRSECAPKNWSQCGTNYQSECDPKNLSNNDVNECEKTISDDTSLEEHTTVIRKMHQSTWSSNGLVTERTEEETIDHRGHRLSNVSLNNHASSSLFQPPTDSHPHQHPQDTSPINYPTNFHPQYFPPYPFCACACSHNCHYVYPHLICNCNAMCQTHWKYLTPLLTTCYHYPEQTVPRKCIYPPTVCPPASNSMPSISGAGIVVPRCRETIDDAVQCQETCDHGFEATLPCGVISPLKGVWSKSDGFVSMNSSQTHRKIEKSPSGSLVIHECERKDDAAVEKGEGFNGGGTRKKRISFIHDGRLLDQDADEEIPLKPHLVSPPP